MHNLSPATPTRNQLSLKLFIGLQISSEIRMHLNQSNVWHQLSISPIKNQQDLSEIHFRGKNYLGFYIKQEKVALHEIAFFETQIKEKLKAYCLKLECQSLHPCIFAQVFIA